MKEMFYDRAYSSGHFRRLTGALAGPTVSGFRAQHPDNFEMCWLRLWHMRACGNRRGGLEEENVFRSCRRALARHDRPQRECRKGAGCLRTLKRTEKPHDLQTDTLIPGT
jgi:hypothetical protein